MTISAEYAERIYSTYSGIYDLLFDTILQAGRERGVSSLNIRPGDRVLEVGVGTGLSLPFYPSHCEVKGIDISAAMLEKSEKRARELGLRNVSFARMAAESLDLADASFDRVLASYVISTVADPARVVGELWRVCRPGGTVVIVNHFRSRRRLIATAETILTPLTRKLGFVLNLNLERVMADGHFTLEGIEKVNLPPLWSLVRLARNPSRLTAD